MGGAALNTGLHTWREDGRRSTKHGTTYLEGRWEEQHLTRDYIPGGKMGGAAQNKGLHTWREDGRSTKHGSSRGRGKMRRRNYRSLSSLENTR